MFVNDGSVGMRPCHFFFRILSREIVRRQRSGRLQTGVQSIYVRNRGMSLTLWPLQSEEDPSPSTPWVSAGVASSVVVRLHSDSTLNRVLGKYVSADLFRIHVCHIVVH